MNKLKPCPFCGEPPYVSEHAVPRKVCCNNRDCPLGPNPKVGDGFGRGSFASKYFQINDWNTRCTPERESVTPAELQEAVRDRFHRHGLNGLNVAKDLLDQFEIRRKA